MKHKMNWFLVLPVVLTLTAGCLRQIPAQKSSAIEQVYGDGGKIMKRVQGRVEAACGQCQLGLPGEGCDLAVRIEGKAYFVDGTGIDEHGDAHAQDGFCNSIRQAEVDGHLEDGRFVARSFHMVPQDGE